MSEPLLSLCCFAPLSVVGDRREGTCYHLCTACHEPANPATDTRSELLASQDEGLRLSTILFTLHAENERLRAALTRLRDCDWTIGRGDRMDPVRDIAREALNPTGRIIP